MAVIHSNPPFMGTVEELQGVSKDLYPDLEKLRSVRILEKFKEIANIQGVMLIGSSGAGKTTLINALREAHLPDVDFPIRFTTRPPRLNDDLKENEHIDQSTFEEKVGSSEIGIHWVRSMEEGRKESYGFAQVDERKISIYSGNNDCIEAITSKTTLVLGISALKETREKRLAIRSPDIGEKERAYRLQDASEKISSASHLLIMNDEEHQEDSVRDIVAVVQSIIKNRVPWGEIRYLGNYQSKHESRLFEIGTYNVLFSSGVIKNFEIVRRSPGVRTLITDGQSLLITKEWREELNKWDYRLPGGKVFDTISEYLIFTSSGSSKEKLQEVTRLAACKEVSEECGLQLPFEKFELSQVSKCGAIVEWDLHYFIVRLESTPVTPVTTISKEGESTQNHWINLKEVKQLCLDGLISEARTALFIINFLEKCNHE